MRRFLVEEQAGAALLIVMLLVKEIGEGNAEKFTA
jgi:hypothetical protein